VKLTSVACEVLGMSGRRIIEALIAGERDGDVLAELAIGRLRNKRAALAEAVVAGFSSHHALSARQILDHVDFLDARIAQVCEQVGVCMAGFEPAIALLLEVPGISRRSAEVVIAETGGDMGRFRSPAHLASWAGLCPGNHESAGKRRLVGTTKGNPWLRRTLIESARAAARTKDSYFAAQYRRLAPRRGPNKAAVAVAHSLLDVIWHLLSTGERYVDLGADYYERRRDRERDTRRLVRQLEDLGHTVNLTPTAA
jgi:transposase